MKQPMTHYQMCERLLLYLGFKHENGAWVCRRYQTSFEDYVLRGVTVSEFARYLDSHLLTDGVVDSLVNLWLADSLVPRVEDRPLTVNPRSTPERKFDL